MSNEDQTPVVHIVYDNVEIKGGQISPVIDQLPPPPPTQSE